MATQIVMPQLGESVAEGIIGKWLKQEGDSIAKDEPIVEVVTDKVNAEIPFPWRDLVKISAAEGETVEIGQEIAVIGDASDAGAGNVSASSGESQATAAESDVGVCSGKLEPAAKLRVLPPSRAAPRHSRRRLHRPRRFSPRPQASRMARIASSVRPHWFSAWRPSIMLTLLTCPDRHRRPCQ